MIKLKEHRMKQKVCFIVFLVWSGYFLSHPGGLLRGETSGETFNIAHEELFGKLQRPRVAFPHDLHIESLEQDGDSCGACHHLYDADRRTLVRAD